MGGGEERFVGQKWGWGGKGGECPISWGHDTHSLRADQAPKGAEGAPLPLTSPRAPQLQAPTPTSPSAAPVSLAMWSSSERCTPWPMPKHRAVVRSAADWAPPFWLGST